MDTSLAALEKATGVKWMRRSELRRLHALKMASRHHFLDGHKCTVEFSPSQGPGSYHDFDWCRIAFSPHLTKEITAKLSEFQGTDAHYRHCCVLVDSRECADGFECRPEIWEEFLRSHCKPMERAERLIQEFRALLRD